jgi:hypothetical protein
MKDFAENFKAKPRTTRCRCLLVSMPAVLAVVVRGGGVHGGEGSSTASRPSKVPEGILADREQLLFGVKAIGIAPEL